MTENVVSVKSDAQRNIMKWVVWGILVFAYAINYFHAFSMGSVKSMLVSEFHLSESIFVAITSMYSYLYLIMQIPSGIMIDTIGAKKTSLGGVLFAGIGITIFSMAQGVEMLFIGRALVGLGTSVIFVSVLKIQAEWFESSKFGMMTGITCFIGTCGGVVAQTPLTALVEATGWRTSLQIIGGVTFLTAILIMVLVKNTPQEAGFNPVNEPVEDDSEKVSILKGVKSILVNPRTWPVLVMYGAFYGSFMVIMGVWGNEYISRVYNISSLQASSFITVGVLGSAIGAYLIGIMTDKMGSRKKPLLITGTVYLLCWVILTLFVDNMTLNLLMLLMFMLGFMSYAYVVSWSCVIEVNDPKYVGLSSSIANIGGFIGSVLIPTIAGAVFDSQSYEVMGAAYYQKAFGVVAITVAVGVVASLLVKETNNKNIYKAR